MAIAFLIKRGGESKADAVVRHAQLWGPRDVKYDWLNAQDLKHTDWVELKPESPFYFFVPRNEEHSGQYQTFTRITEVFPINVTGIVTARDRFVLDFDRDALLRRIGQFRDRSLPDEFIRQAYGLKDTRGWKLSQRRRDLAAIENWRDHAVPCLYRPFDTRVLYYHPYMVDWGRPEVMRHMLAGENMALLTCRQLSKSGWEHAWISNTLADDCLVSNRTRERGYVFPLYLYPTADRADLFSHHEPSERQPNLNPTLVSALTEAYGKKPAPEEIFRYVYAVLYAPTYRTKYAEFLRMDFPRVPFTSDAKLFQKLAALGARLTALHLLTSPELDPPTCRFEGEGDSRIGKGRKAGFRYEPGEQRAYITATQYFAPVAEAVWSYQVGGYQVCEKWLKDRQERRLAVDDIRTYCRIVTALGRTLVIQTEIDALYPDVEQNVVAIPGHTAAVEFGSPAIASTRQRTRRAPQRV